MAYFGVEESRKAIWDNSETECNEVDMHYCLLLLRLLRATFASELKRLDVYHEMRVCCYVCDANHRMYNEMYGRHICGAICDLSGRS